MKNPSPSPAATQQINQLTTQQGALRQQRARMAVRGREISARLAQIKAHRSIVKKQGTPQPAPDGWWNNYGMPAGTDYDVIRLCDL